VQAPIPATAAPSGGLLITGLTSRDLEGFDPLYLQPTIDLGLNEGRIEPGDGSFPASLQRIAPGASASPDRLLIAAGQFQDLLDGPGVQRIFTSVDGDLYPAVDTGSVEPPRFSRVIGRVGDDEAVVQFDVTTDDSAERVYVLFREVPAGGFGPTATVWRGLDLARAQDGDGQDIWIGGDTITVPGATVEFFVQAAGANGRVGITDNKVYNYLTSLPDESDSLTIDLDGPLGDNGYYTGAVTARVTDSTKPETVTYSVDAGPFLPGDVEFEDAPNGVSVSENGGHVVLARDDAGGREFVFFVIDQDGPTVQAETFAPPEAGSVTVSLTASDVGQSGVASITYTVTPPEGGGDPFTETVVGTATTEIVVDQPGTTIITAFATDRAGNVTPQEERVTIDVVIDDDPPVVTASADPTAAVTGWVNTDVAVTVDATDDSGVASITIHDATTTIDPATTSASATATITQEGENSVAYSATDVAGNTSASSPIRVGIDKTKPTAEVSVAPATDDSNGILEFGEPAVATFACDDALSGVESCVVSVDGSVIDDPDGDGVVIVPTTTIGTRTVTVTARDKAGNVETATATYTVPYRVCLQYDPDQAKNIGSNYTIKLSLCDAAGKNVANRRFQLTAISVDGVADPGPNFNGNANPDYLFRFTGGSFTYNLDTSTLPAQGIGPGRHYLEFEIVAPSGFVSTATAPFTLS
jgi:hypothetical protein